MLAFTHHSSSFCSRCDMCDWCYYKTSHNVWSQTNNILCMLLHSRSQGVHWVQMHPQGGEKIGGGIYRGIYRRCTVHPTAERAPRRLSKSPIFEDIGEIWTVGVVNLVVLACVLRATTKKGRQLLGGRTEQCTPRENPGYAYLLLCMLVTFYTVNVRVSW